MTRYREPRFNYRTQHHPLSETAQRILALVNAEPGILRVDIGRRLDIKLANLGTKLDTLEDQDLVHRERVGGPFGYRLAYYPGPEPGA